jgi:hypothetical protein
MAFSLDIKSLVVNSITSLVNSSVIIGLPTAGAPTPLFCLCEIPEETIRGSVRLPGALTQAGEMKTRSVIQPSEYTFQAAISEHDGKNSDIFKSVQVALTAIASIINSLASFGAILPNFSSIATGYVDSQIASLTQMKNNMQPIIILSAYFSLGVVQQGTPYLSSSWYIEEFEASHEGGKDGTVLKIRLKELFAPRNLSTLGGASSAIAAEILSPLAGVAVGSLW